MKQYFLLFLFLLCKSFLFSQSYQKISRPEKFWAITHPFVAKKAYRITKEVRVDIDSMKRSGEVGTDGNGGNLDALRHAWWMTCLTAEIGKRKALKLGKAHEKGNYLQFKHHTLEDAMLPDSVSCAMDLKNNEVGAELGEKLEKERNVFIDNQLSVLIGELEKGKLFVIKKDKLGNYLYCDGTFINTNEWLGKWGIPKCLISSSKY